MDANKRVTELGLLDKVFREQDDEQKEYYNPAEGYGMTLHSYEPETITMVFTPYRMFQKTSVGNVMLWCEEMHVGEFIKYFSLEVYSDIDKISLDQVWKEFYLTGRAEIEFDARPPFRIKYSKESEVQTPEDLRKYCEGLDG
ncbi:MAG: hypothetical protein V4594_05305 [Bacteroidota bacterium]